MTPDQVLSSPSLADSIEAIVSSDVFRIVLRYLRDTAPGAPLGLHAAEHWQQTRIDALRSGWDGCISALETLPDVIRENLAGSANEDMSQIPPFAQDNDLPDHVRDAFGV